MHRLILTYFDKLIGPLIKFTVPHTDIAEDNVNVRQLMDLTEEKGFFGHVTGKEFISNYLFEIPSPLARGKKEVLMLSFICDIKYDFDEIEDVFERYVDKFKNASKIYYAFYPNKKVENDVYKTALRKAKSFLNECFKECMNVTQNQIFGKVLVIGLEQVGKSTIIQRIHSYGMPNDQTDLLDDLNNIVKFNIPHNSNNSHNPNNPNNTSIGLKILKVIAENIVFDIYDINPKGLNYCFDDIEKPDAIIYVVDDDCCKYLPKQVVDQFDEVIMHFFGDECTNKLIADTPVLILGNKVDVLGLSNKNFIETLIKPERFYINYHVGYISAKTNQGIAENFVWLVTEFIKNAKFPSL